MIDYNKIATNEILTFNKKQSFSAKVNILSASSLIEILVRTF